MDYSASVRSDWSSASLAGRRSVAGGTPSSSAGAGTVSRLSDYKPTYSSLKQEILTEEEYTEGLSEAIKRTFFPQLRELDAHNELIRAYESEDPEMIEESVRKMREIVTPTPRRRNRGATPGRTPFGTDPSFTPTTFSETPSRTPSSSHPGRQHRTTRYDPTLSVDAFQARYTSEDNSSFAEILAKDNKARKEKYSWAYEAERKANAKAIRGREARERLVDVTREMVEAGDGVVKMIEGRPGRPGERQLMVNPGMEVGGSRLMIKAPNEGGRLLITSPEGEQEEKGKGKLVESKFIDMDKAVAEEQEENQLPMESEMQIPVEGYKFTNRNSLMFPPDANGGVEQGPAKGSKEDTDAPGTPKAIRYHATRLAEVERAPPGAPSPTRSRINAAVTGTPYHGNVSATPKVQGFSFVDALPSPRASTIPAKDLQELMTWGTIESTPVLRSSASAARSALGEGGGPFRIEDTSRREALAHKMANKAKRSLAEKAGGSGSSAGGLRRSVLDSVRSRVEGGGTPRSPRVGELSPAARNLLGKTGQGRKLEKGISTTEGWKEEDRKRARRQIAEVRARELESQDRLKRTRWTPSPAPSLGFDPDLP
ncbi:protein DGCR14-like protein [Pseudohyphozyma bogoriensis]|nr:protein DGCR14-like protein [Pseudohyphozyma bogoriensis]